MKNKKLLEPIDFDRAAFGEVGTLHRLDFMKASLQKAGDAGVSLNSIPVDKKFLGLLLRDMGKARLVERAGKPALVDREPNPIAENIFLGLRHHFFQ